MSDEREDYDNLLKAPGWLRLDQHFRTLWNDQIANFVTRAIDDRDDLQALSKLRQVSAARKAVFEVLSFPKERVRQVKHAIDMDATGTTEAFANRRGSL